MIFDKKVENHQRRSLLEGLPASLTQYEWQETLVYFHHRCAYCLIGNYDVLEHVIPVKQGGGTTANNCVPACYSCNNAKGRTNRVLLGDPQKAQEALSRVSTYLASRGRSIDDRSEAPSVQREAEDPLFPSLKAQALSHGHRASSRLSQEEREALARTLIYLYERASRGSERQALAVAVSLLIEETDS